MEIKSDPKFETIKITDLDIAFPGDLQTFMLKDGTDTMTLDRENQTITLTFAVGGTVTLNLKHAHYFASRTRTIKQEVKEPKE